jgi:hypothetical protein
MSGELKSNHLLSYDEAFKEKKDAFDKRKGFFFLDFRVFVLLFLLFDFFCIFLVVRVL